MADDRLLDENKLLITLVLYKVIYLLLIVEI